MIKYCTVNNIINIILKFVPFEIIALATYWIIPDLIRYNEIDIHVFCDNRLASYSCERSDRMFDDNPHILFRLNFSRGRWVVLNVYYLEEVFNHHWKITLFSCVWPKQCSPKSWRSISRVSITHMPVFTQNLNQESCLKLSAIVKIAQPFQYNHVIIKHWKIVGSLSPISLISLQ